MINKLDPKSKILTPKVGLHLLNLINDILTISKIEAGDTKFNNTLVDLNVMMAEISEMFTLQAGKLGINLLFKDWYNHDMFIMTDETKLKQVLINIIGNSIKFISEGYIKKRYKHEKIRYFESSNP